MLSVSASVLVSKSGALTNCGEMDPLLAVD